jgi:hypothetical protein
MARKQMTSWKPTSALIAGLLGALVSASCGGSSAPTNIAAGGEATGAPICADGDTRECTGPRACAGGQVCRNAEWGDCDCGLGDGGSAVGGNAGTGATSGSFAQAGVPSGGADLGSAGAAGSRSENINWEDDPCADEGLKNGSGTIDCSNDCPAAFHPQQNSPLACSVKAKCELTTLSIAASEDAGPLPPDTEISEYVHRTPRSSTIDGPCNCPTGQAIFAKYKVGVSLPDSIQLTVRPPWHFGVDPSSTCADEGQQCVDGSGKWEALLWTEYPDAPAVNVAIKLGPCD